MKDEAEIQTFLQLFGAFVLDQEEWRAIFAPNGKLLLEGEHIARPAYGRTLALLAERGADAFYHGAVAESSVKTIKKAGGMMTLENLANYKAIVLPAVRGTYRNMSIYTTHGPSSGPVLIHLLKVMDGFELEEQGRTPLNIHRFVETLKCRSSVLLLPASPEQSLYCSRICSSDWSW